MSVGRHISLLNVAYPGQTGWESRGAIMSNLIPLINIPVPPMLEQALGYEGQHRYVAFWWEPAGDELAWDDGQSGVVGANWHAWLIYEQHPRVAPHLESYQLGNSDEPARHWLLLDRQERMLYVGTTPDVTRFLAQHTPLAPAITPGEDAVSLEDALNMGIDKLLASMREIPPPSQAEIRKRMEEQARLEADLVVWLDHQIN
jgi:hypothetical protein